MKPFHFNDKTNSDKTSDLNFNAADVYQEEEEEEDEEGEMMRKRKRTRVGTT